MGTDDQYINLKNEIRTCGPGALRNRYAEKREEALNRGDQDEADLWETRRQSVGVYVKQRRFRYKLFSFIAGATLALLPSGYIWLQQEILVTIISYLIFTASLYVVIRDMAVGFSFWVAGLSFIFAIGLLGWESYIWLREARWPGFSVLDAFSWIGIRPSFVWIEDWAGVEKIINAIFIWIFELSLPFACFIIGVIFLGIGLKLVEIDWEE